ncbi:BON domain-containing protein [Bradyrhizobium sp. LMG 9283]|uniref:BON domain-containing protein n=1 Tax=Bradyrhizobium sp. LMG 9283 TaxID=592064 RepID=UPI00388F5F3C
MTVRNRFVQLHGIITIDEARQATIVAAENTDGVKKVHDHLCFVDSYCGFYVVSPQTRRRGRSLPPAPSTDPARDLGGSDLGPRRA